MIKIKRFLSYLVIIVVIAMVSLNFNKIQDKVVSYMKESREVVVKPGNAYTKNKDYLFVKHTDNYKPTSYQDLINIFYSILDQGWTEFTFYCPTEYTNCLSDVTKISNDDILLSNINNYVHPFNSYSSIKTVYDETGEVTMKVIHQYSDNEIQAINQKVESLINSITNSYMDTATKVLTVHDYIINNTKYDTNKTVEHSAKSNGVLFNGYGICSGYTDTMAIFLYKFGIDNIRVSSDTHIWNAVLVNDSWLHLDLTWDDPVTSSGKDTLSHDYYLITTKQLLARDTNTNEHKFDNQYYLYFNVN